jgi:hypothetical protein
LAKADIFSACSISRASYDSASHFDSTAQNWNNARETVQAPDFQIAQRGGASQNLHLFAR